MVYYSQNYGIQLCVKTTVTKTTNTTTLCTREIYTKIKQLISTGVSANTRSKGRYHYHYHYHYHYSITIKKKQSSFTPPAVHHSLRVLNSTLADLGQAKNLAHLLIYENIL